MPNKRLQALSARGDPLEAIDRLVPWESFSRRDRGGGADTGRAQEKAAAGPEAVSMPILMFRMLVSTSAQQSVRTSRWNIRWRDRLSFLALFWGLAIEDSIPGRPRRFGLFREKLAKAGMIEKAV